MKNTKTLYSKIIALIFIFFFSAACAGMSGGATQPDGIEESGSGTTAPGGGGGDVMPPISIAPKGIDQKFLVASAQDEGGITPVVGYDGAVDLSQANGDYQVVVSDKEISVAPTEDLSVNVNAVSKMEEGAAGEGARDTGHGARKEKSLFARLYSSFLKLVPSFQTLVPNAVADGESDVCNETGVTCCPISETGSFECPAHGDNTSQYFVYINKKGTDELSDPVIEAVNPNVLYLRKAPKSVAVLSGGAEEQIATLTEGLGTKIKNDGEFFYVANDFNANYTDMGFELAADAQQIAADTSGNIGALEPVGGIDTLLVDQLGLISDRTTTNNMVPETAKYNQLKLGGDGELRFVRKPLTFSNREFIYHGIDGVNNAITFVQPLDTDAGITVFASNIVTFDTFYINDIRPFTIEQAQSNKTDYGLAVFEDDQNDVLRIRFGYHADITTPVLAIHNRYGIVLGAPADYDFKDLQIYYDNGFTISPTFEKTVQDGQALLLDAKASKVGVVKFNVYNDRTITGAVPKINFVNWVSLGINKNAVAMTLNKTKTKAYVLNQGDNTISVLKLFNNDGSPKSPAQITASIKTISIASILGDKNINITPNAITYVAKEDAEYLMLGAQGLKSNLVVNLTTTTFVESALPQLSGSLPTVISKDEALKTQVALPDVGVSADM